jgi:hypothetical protein
MPLAMSCVEPHPGWTISRPIYGPTPTAPKGSRVETAVGQVPALEAAFKAGGVHSPQFRTITRKPFGCAGIPAVLSELVRLLMLPQFTDLYASSLAPTTRCSQLLSGNTGGNSRGLTQDDRCGL